MPDGCRENSDNTDAASDGAADASTPDDGTGAAAEAAAVRAATAAPAATGRRRLVVAALMLAMALTAMDSSVVSTAVPQIVGDLGGFSYFAWMFSGYLLTVTVTLPVYGKLADSIGRKPVLLVGCGIFLLGSLLCATAWNMPSLIVFRLVQGLGGGAIQGTVQTIAADLYKLKERGRIQAAMSTVWAVSAVAGPTVGGVLASCANWRWIFLVNLPIGGFALLLLLRELHESVDRTRRGPIDWAGAVGLFCSAGLLLFALVQGGVAWAWRSAPSLAVFAASALAAGLTVWIERRAAEPIIPGWVWRRRVIAGVNLALGFLGVLMIAPTVFLPMYAQSVLGLAPVAAGFVLSVMTLSWPLSAALSGRVYLRIGFRDTALIGGSSATLVLLGFVLLPFGGAAWQPAAVMLALGACLGLFQLPLIVGVQSSVPWHERGTATASILFCRQVGQSLGGVLFAVVANTTLAHWLRDAPAQLRGGLPGSLDDVSDALLDRGRLSAAATDYLRHTVAAAVSHVYLGAAGAAALAVVVLCTVTPRRFPVVDDS